MGKAEKFGNQQKLFKSFVVVKKNQEIDKTENVKKKLQIALLRKKRINSKLGVKKSFGVMLGSTGAIFGGAAGVLGTGGLASGGLAVAGGSTGFGIGAAITAQQRKKQKKIADNLVITPIS